MMPAQNGNNPQEGEKPGPQDSSRCSGLGAILQVSEGMLDRAIAINAQDEDTENRCCAGHIVHGKPKEAERQAQVPFGRAEVEDVHGHDDSSHNQVCHREADDVQVPHSM